ncbi:RidA family protein [Hydrogenophaga sp.]|uniref:RidA family protein n=1 Tax=Hydrogenophaga sp. TaxID=1904254 RepID=UPI002FCC4CE9
MNNSIRQISPVDMAPPGGHYSHATIANGLVFVSGQLPITPSGERLHQASFEAQTRQTLANAQSALEAAGSSVAQLVQVRVYITNIDNWPVFNQLYMAWAGQSMPARAVVPVPELHHGFALEVEAVAATK